jgi:hypothetical protein
MMLCAAVPHRPEYCLRRPQTPDTPDPDIEALDQLEAASGDPATLLCAACGQIVTWRTSLFNIQGGTEHRFTNPHGFRFRIACYRDAPGCRGTGDWTAEHSWFNGCQWRFALCAACHTHLGWEYRGTANFFGLIQERLVESESGNGLQ